MAPAKASELERFVLDLKMLLRKGSAEYDSGVRGGLTWLARACPSEVVVAASGPKITRMAARIADGAILLQGVAPDLLERGIGWLRDGAEDAGRDFDRLSITCWTPLGIGTTSAAGRDDVRARVASAVMQTNPDWFEGEEREAIRQAEGVLSETTSMPRRDPTMLHSSRIAWSSVMQSPATLSRFPSVWLRSIAHPRLDRIVLTPQGGAASLDEVLLMLKKNVLPKVRSAAR